MKLHNLSLNAASRARIRVLCLAPLAFLVLSFWNAAPVFARGSDVDYRAITKAFKAIGSRGLSALKNRRSPYRRSTQIIRIPQIPTPPAPPAPRRPPAAPARPFSPVEKAYIEKMRDISRQMQEEARRQEEVKAAESELQKLLEEFGPTAKCQPWREFLYIYDTTDSYAYWCASNIENAANAYLAFARKLKIPTTPLEDPMIVVVFKRKDDYDAYIKKVAGSEFELAKNKPVGCYFPTPNRAVFYDLTGVEATKREEDDVKKRPLEEILKDIGARPRVEENLSVVVHETAHQVSYNLGLFSRIGENPAWAVEGLATLFETPIETGRPGEWKIVRDFPINKARVMEFQNYVKTTTDLEPVKKCVSLDKIRGDEPCAYPLSWAIFYYLYKNYPKELAYYLHYNQLQQPRMSFSEYARMQEFVYFFGDDWDGMYLQLKVFVQALENQLNGMSPEEAELKARRQYNLPDEDPQTSKAKAPKAKKDPKTNGQSEKKNVAETKVEKSASKPEPQPQSAANANSQVVQKKTPKASQPPKKQPVKKAEDKKFKEETDDWLNSWETGEKPTKER